MPAAGVGTFLPTPDEAEASGLSALQCGWRLIDAAQGDFVRLRGEARRPPDRGAPLLSGEGAEGVPGFGGRRHPGVVSPGPRGQSAAGGTCLCRAAKQRCIQKIRFIRISQSFTAFRIAALGKRVVLDCVGVDQIIAFTKKALGIPFQFESVIFILFEPLVLLQ